MFDPSLQDEARAENLRRQAEYYESLLDKHGEKCEALDWNEKSSQKLRYKVFKDIFNYTTQRSLDVLDVGCGFGDFWEFLKKEKVTKDRRIKYTGIDISEKLIEIARRRHKDAKFDVKNILKDDLKQRFDIVFCSGAFNIRFMDVEAHVEYVKDLLLKMFQLSKIGVAANFLSASAVYLVDEEDLNLNRYFYFRADNIIDFCRSFSSKYVLRHDYHAGDFTVYLLR